MQPAATFFLLYHPAPFPFATGPHDRATDLCPGADGGPVASRKPARPGGQNLMRSVPRTPWSVELSA